MTFLVQQTLIYAVPLMIVALAGVFAERSGIINLALEGIMIFGAFIGVLFVRTMQGSEVFAAAKAAGDYATLQGLEIMAMVVAALLGAIFSLLLSFASINLRADQTIGGTALNLMAPALVLFFIRIIANQNTLQMATGDSASWFMLKKSTFGVDKNVDWGFFGETFLNKIYLATYICILLDITDVFEGPAYDSDTPLKDVILPGYLDSKKFQPYGDGKIYIAPKDCGYSGMVYNKALFEAKGWAVPETWDEFFALGDQAKAEGRALFTYQGIYPSYLESLLWPAIADVVGAEGINSIFNYEEGSPAWSACWPTSRRSPPAAI
jgi:hypothetical protein